MKSTLKGSLIFVGTGLFGTQDLTLQAVSQISCADKVYFDTYTSLVTGTSVTDFAQALKKPIIPLARKDLEENPEQGILQDAKTKNTVLLVPGDPMVSTTHVDLRIRATEMGIPTQIIHGISVHTAALSACGLENYKAGLSVTLPFTTEDYAPDSPYFRLAENFNRGLHTLIYLDIKAEKQRFMTIHEGIHNLLAMEEKHKKRLITEDHLFIGLARIGTPHIHLETGTAQKLLEMDFGPPPHMLIMPGKLHYMETKALVLFANAPPSILKTQ